MNNPNTFIELCLPTVRKWFVISAWLIASGMGVARAQTLVKEYIYVNGRLVAIESQPATSAPAAPNNFDGDLKTDLTVWRPSTNIWYTLLSSTGNWTSTQWGQASDIPVPGDYDGDRKTDVAIWRPSTGIWYIIPSSAPSTYIATSWGLSSDLPVLGDFDGDGKTDVAVWRPSTGYWYILLSSVPGSWTSTQWGQASDVPVPGDYDGDGKTISPCGGQARACGGFFPAALPARR